MGWLAVGAHAKVVQGPIAPRTTRLDSLTGLRFVAALAVFGVHAAEQLWPGNSSVTRATWQGISGVSFFFILSGFVLAWSYRPGLAVREFYRRRAARILPLYYLALLAALALHLHRGGPSFAADAAPSLALVQSWIPRQPIYFGGNGPGWSLSCEMFFYALLPLIAAVLMKRHSRLLWWALGACVLGSVAIALLLRPQSSKSFAYWILYVLPLTRIIEFVAGVSLGLAMRRGWRSPVPFSAAGALALGSYVALGWAPRYLLPAAAMFVPYLLLISSAATSDLAATGSLFRQRWFVRLGEWSFAFYLFHQSIITFAVGAASRFHLGDSGRVFAMIGALGASILVSAALYLWFEMPLERRFRSPRGDAAGPTALPVAIVLPDGVAEAVVVGEVAAH